MKIRRVLLLTPFLLVLLLAVSYYAAESWLESTGGKRALEQTLSDRVGMPIHLGGDFNLRLFPKAGVSATQLAVHDPATGDEIATGNYLEADLALAPLLREELDVQRLLVEGLKIRPPGGNVLFFPRITLRGFSPGRPTDFEIDWNWMGQLDGQFTWFAGDARVELDMEWRADDRDDIGYRGRIRYAPGLVRFEESGLAVGAQSASGEGCLLLDNSPELNLLLESERLDLDSLAGLVPGGNGATGSLPFRLNLRIDAAEIRSGDTVAYDTTLEVGRRPVCP